MLAFIDPPLKNPFFIILLISDKPVCKEDQRTLFGVAKREPIQVPCTVEADPPEVNFRWLFNNSFDLVPITNFVHQPPNSMTSVANYAPRTKYGYGQLLCWATNKLGLSPFKSFPCSS